MLDAAKDLGTARDGTPEAAKSPSRRGWRKAKVPEAHGVEASTPGIKSSRVLPLASTMHEIHEGEDELVGLLLPNITFLRDSANVLLRQLRSRAPVLKLLRELSAQPGSTKGTRIQATTWLERHFSTGEGANGRLYFCPGVRPKVLVSFKAMQSGDIRYLKEQEA
jgi:hypothetical protein